MSSQARAVFATYSGLKVSTMTATSFVSFSPIEASALPGCQVLPRAVQAQHLFDERHSHAKDPGHFPDRHCALLDCRHHPSSEFFGIWYHDSSLPIGRTKLKIAIRDKAENRFQATDAVTR